MALFELKDRETGQTFRVEAESQEDAVARLERSQVMSPARRVVEGGIKRGLVGLPAFAAEAVQSTTEPFRRALQVMAAAARGEGTVLRPEPRLGQALERFVEVPVAQTRPERYGQEALAGAVGGGLVGGSAGLLGRLAGGAASGIGGEAAAQHLGEGARPLGALAGGALPALAGSVRAVLPKAAAARALQGIPDDELMAARAAAGEAVRASVPVTPIQALSRPGPLLAEQELLLSSPTQGLRMHRLLAQQMDEGEMAARGLMRAPPGPEGPQFAIRPGLRMKPDAPKRIAEEILKEARRLHVPANNPARTAIDALAEGVAQARTPEELANAYTAFNTKLSDVRMEPKARDFMEGLMRGARRPLDVALQEMQVNRPLGKALATQKATYGRLQGAIDEAFSLKEGMPDPRGLGNVSAALWGTPEKQAFLRKEVAANAKAQGLGEPEIAEAVRGAERVMDAIARAARGRTTGALRDEAHVVAETGRAAVGGALYPPQLPGALARLSRAIGGRFVDRRLADILSARTPEGVEALRELSHYKPLDLSRAVAQGAGAGLAISSTKE